MLKDKELIDAISRAYSDPKIKNYGHLADELLGCAKQLVEGKKNSGEICYKISNLISKYSFEYHFELPSSLVELQLLVSKMGQVYRGWGSIGIWS